jgi:FlaA1/EpsC-like NDP-sugar epimerase
MSILIFGGTGTLGRALVKQIGTATPIHIVSRCEVRQKQMVEDFPEHDLRMHVGDVASDSWKHKLNNIKFDCVFNLAAMKHVEIGEVNVESCIRNNLEGVINSYKWCDPDTQYVFSSTDKGVLPVNAYGYAKALAEKFLYDMSSDYNNVTVYRWGNVIGSRGSVFHAFRKTLKEHGSVNITHEDMTRFLIHIDDVANFMWSKRYESTDKLPHIPDMKAATIVQLADAVADVMGVEDYVVNDIGIRDGEKIHECLHTSHEHCYTSENAERFTPQELQDLVRRCFDGT